MLKYKFIIIILFNQFISILTFNNSTIDVFLTTSAPIKIDHNDSSCRNLFLVISLTSLFIYLLSICIVDYLSKEHLPEVYSNKSKEKQSIILSKYLVRLVFGKWSSNFEFSSNSLLNIQLSSHDPKLISGSFSIPTEWLKTLMDHVGTKENPLLKSIKFYVYQPESLGLISSVKLNLKDLKNLNSYIYLESIELSKTSDNKIQVINIQKNVKFANTNQIQLITDLGFKTNAKINAYDGYSPYFLMTDYIYFYILYLEATFLILNSVHLNWLYDLKYETFDFKRIVFNSFIKSIICTLIVILISIFYLFFIRLKLSKQHNSDLMQILNIIYLSGIFLFLFVLNYLFCEDEYNEFRLKKSNFLVQFAVMQLFFFFTFALLWSLSNFSKSQMIKSMILKPSELISIQNNRLENNLSEKTDSNLSASILTKRQSTDIKSTDLKSITHPKSNKNLSKRSATAFKQFTQLAKKTALPTKDESPLKRVDSDNSIGSGYYHQMITATKHVRSISQYGELLRDNKN